MEYYKHYYRYSRVCQYYVGKKYLVDPWQ